MVIAKIYGGLAGQMLQYSLGRHLSLINGTDLYLDLSWYRTEKSQEFVRDFGLHNLQTKFKEVGQNNLLRWKVRAATKLGKMSPFNLKYVKEVDFSVFDSGILSIGDNKILDGYWNSYKYFNDIRTTLQEEFRPKKYPCQANKQCLEMIKNVNSVSVHFRRGDYALTEFHGVLSKEYYVKAIEIIKERVVDPYLFVFSDEPEWVISNFEFDLPFKIVDFNKDSKNYWDIELMKNCRHNVIANSGFSWWAAWLNCNPGKIVLAPRKWINTGKGRIDNVPDDWILL